MLLHADLSDTHICNPGGQTTTAMPYTPYDPAEWMPVESQAGADNAHLVHYDISQLSAVQNSL